MFGLQITNRVISVKNLNAQHLWIEKRLTFDRLDERHQKHIYHILDEQIVGQLNFIE